MLKWLQNIGLKSDKSSSSSINGIEDSSAFAVTILLIEVMHADHQLDESEKRMILHLLQQQFGMDKSDADELYVAATTKMRHAVSLHRYTSRLNSDFSYEQKQQFMTNLWQVIFADGQIDKYEEHLARRIADLIYLSHKDFIKSKHIAETNSHD